MGLCDLDIDTQIVDLIKSTIVRSDGKELLSEFLKSFKTQSKNIDSRIQEMRNSIKECKRIKHTNFDKMYEVLEKYFHKEYYFYVPFEHMRLLRQVAGKNRFYVMTAKQTQVKDFVFTNTSMFNMYCNLYNLSDLSKYNISHDNEQHVNVLNVAIRYHCYSIYCNRDDETFSVLCRTETDEEGNYGPVIIPIATMLALINLPINS
jgi:hypothetical protein